MKKSYVQFSKRMVVLVVISADIFTAIALYVLLCMDAAEGIVSVMQAFLIFSGLVFVAYCGNSAVEKWVLSQVNMAQSTGWDSQSNG